MHDMKVLTRVELFERLDREDGGGSRALNRWLAWYKVNDAAERKGMRA